MPFRAIGISPPHLALGLHWTVAEIDRDQISLVIVHPTPGAAWQTVQADGQYQVNAKTGAITEHPAGKKLDALRRDYIKVLLMLGLRTAVATPDTKNESALEDFLNA
jgi:hypothetical protein